MLNTTLTHIHHLRGSYCPFYEIAKHFYIGTLICFMRVPSFSSIFMCSPPFVCRRYRNFKNFERCGNTEYWFLFCYISRKRRLVMCWHIVVEFIAIRCFPISSIEWLKFIITSLWCDLSFQVSLVYLSLLLINLRAITAFNAL